MNEEQARKRIADLKGFYGHLGAYIGGCILFVGIWLITTPGGHPWFLYPILGWGIGMLSHAFTTFWGGSDWEERKMEELTGLKNTQDELDKLSDRTETLIRILSDVQWDKIDPDLMQSRQNLEDAQSKIVALKSGGNSGVSRAEVQKEIERLEAFVTSSKFEYYEKAANPPS